MRLRIILLVLSLLTFLSASAGGYLYYSSLKDAAFKDAEQQGVLRLELIARNISFSLNEHTRAVRLLSETGAMLNKLVHPRSREALMAANAVLDLFKRSLEVEVCYLMDHSGTTVASSNRNAPDSFVGKNFAFRPYFQQAIHSAPSTYLALGTTSHRRGIYYSYPVFEEGEDLPIGLVVIKASIERVEKQLKLLEDEIVMVASPEGVIFLCTRKNWLFHTVAELAPAQQRTIAASRQFGQGPWKWIGIDFTGSDRVRDKDGTAYQVHAKVLANYPGWQVYYLRDLAGIYERVSAPLIHVTAPVVVILCTLIGLSVLFLYKKASLEIQHRHNAEKALRRSEARYRSLYHNTPAMLHSIDPRGRLVSVSQYWSESLGYSQEEVLGRQLTDFFTPPSRRHAQQTVFPEFFRRGFCKDVSYQMVKKNGEIIDVLLSAIAERDDEGRIQRSLAVLVDVTEQKRAQAALKVAKEELSRYSRDLERQVRDRTRQITNILKYTPAVVYMKDCHGRYQLVNSRFEELFGLSNRKVSGKTDAELFPRQIADQFQAADSQVIAENRICQSEEVIRHGQSEHIYLSTKFPVFDDSGNVSGVCGIAMDITAVKRAQNQLRRLSARIITSQEGERAAIARELHDELGQVLTALRMDAAWLAERLRKSDGAAARRALTMCALIDDNIEEVRNMALRLRPGVLDDLGLVAALEWYTADVERRAGISCIFEHDRIPEIPNPVATAAYRIAQEALTNVIRHSEADNVEVALKFTRRHLFLSVADNGRGFDPAGLAESEGLGLAGMRERAALVGGTLTVRAARGQGCRVRFEVPVAAA